MREPGDRLWCHCRRFLFHLASHFSSSADFRYPFTEECRDSKQEIYQRGVNRGRVFPDLSPSLCTLTDPRGPMFRDTGVYWVTVMVAIP